MVVELLHRGLGVVVVDAADCHDGAAALGLDRAAAGLWD